MRIEAYINYQRMSLGSVDTLDDGLYRIAYFYENWFPPNEYRLLDDNGQPISLGRKQAICDQCHRVKYMPRELHICFTCMEINNDDRIS